MHRFAVTLLPQSMQMYSPVTCYLISLSNLVWMHWPYLSCCSSRFTQTGGKVHREQPTGAAAPWGPDGAAVGALSRSPQVGLEPGEDGWVCGGGRGWLPDCGDSLLQPCAELQGCQSYIVTSLFRLSFGKRFLVDLITSHIVHWPWIFCTQLHFTRLRLSLWFLASAVNVNMFALCVGAEIVGYCCWSWSVCCGCRVS